MIQKLKSIINKEKTFKIENLINLHNNILISLNKYFHNVLRFLFSILYVIKI